MIKRIYARINKALGFVNGIKGAISLFMAVLMTPFLSIALILVEAGRFNSAVSILDEAMGVSAHATLADYDTFLQDRFGLLAVSQDKDIDTLFSQYMETNGGIMGDSLDISNLKASGENALTDASLQVMYSQIMEFSKLNSPTTLASTFLNISSILSSFEMLAQIGSIMEIVTTGINGINSAVTIAQSAETIKQSAENLEQLEKDYKTSYSSFKSSVSSLISLLANPPEPPTFSEDESAASRSAKMIAYNTEVALYNADVSDAKGDVADARDEYSDVLQSIVDELGTYKEAMSECSEAIKGVQQSITEGATQLVSYQTEYGNKKKDLDALNEEIERMKKEGYTESNPTYQNALDYQAALEGEMAELEMQQGLISAGNDGLSQMSDSLEEAIGSYDENLVNDMIDDFSSLKSTVDAFSVSSVSAESVGISDDKYHWAEFGDYVSSEAIDKYLEDQKNELISGSFIAFFEGMITFYQSIFSLDLFYDTSLCAFIDTDYYKETFGGLPGSIGGQDRSGVIGIIDAIGNLVEQVQDFAGKLLKLKLLQALLQLKNILVAIINIFESIINFATEILTNLWNLLTGYDQMYFSAYTAFNLPCRTDAGVSGTKFTSLSGYSLPSEVFADKNIVSSVISPIDDMLAMVNTIRGALTGSGEDLSFSGAELEYILFGSYSEVGNQLYCFVAIYLLRLICDVFPVLGNAEVQAIATASTIGYPVVMLIVVLLEPLVDAVLLVNGKSIPLIKTSVYLSPSGLPSLIESLVSIASFTTEAKDTIKNGFVNAFGATEDGYDYNLKLKEYEQKNKEKDQAALNGGSGGNVDTTKPNAFQKGVNNYLEGLISFNYREYLFFVLLLTVSKETQNARLANLVQMEALSYYNSQNADYTFDLRNSYTFVKGTADVSVKPMLPSLLDLAKHEQSREVYRGY